VVRNLWEQITFVRDQLTRWEKETSHHVRLKAYSAHYNISYERRPSEENEHRNIQKLALLLAYILPIPVAILGTNRRSTGVGVRPREARIEITSDFTPDPGLMIATAALVTGVVRETMSWPSYELEELDRRPLPVVAGVVPGKHTTRKGWLTKDFHFPRSPFTSDLDARVWRTRDGNTTSLREMARRIAWYYRTSIRRYADPFTVRHLFAILSGRAPSMLELPDRPAAYEDVGRLCAWGMVLPGLRALARGDIPSVHDHVSTGTTYRDWMEERARARRDLTAREAPVADGKSDAGEKPVAAAVSGGNGRARRPGAVALAGGIASRGRAASARRSDDTARRRRRADNPVSEAGTAATRRRVRAIERRRTERRARREPVPFPDRRLSRSAYEQVFLKLVSGGRLRIGAETYTPVGMIGWDLAVFRRDSDGRRRRLSIDQLLKRMADWT
jgi:hypothetical protein